MKDNNKNKDIAILANIKSGFSITINKVLIILGVTLVIIFFFITSTQTRIRDTYIFALTVASVLVTIHSAFYVKKKLDMQIEQRERDMHQDRIRNSFQVKKELDDTLLLRYRIELDNAVDEMMKEIGCDSLDGVPVEVFYEKINKNPELLLKARALLNKFETISLAIQYGNLDEEVLYLDILFIITNTFRQLDSFIKKDRGSNSIDPHCNITLYCEAERLVNSWERRILLSTGEKGPKIKIN